MDDLVINVNERFAAPGSSLETDVMGELQSIMRLHTINPQELFYKWESYSIKMGGDTKLDLKTARDFKKDLQDALERETRGKLNARSNEKRHVGATPRTNKTNADVFGTMDGVAPMTPGTPLSGVNGNSVKRKSDFKTPASKANKFHANSSPNESRTPQSGRTVNGTTEMPFTERTNAGQIVETLNDHISLPDAPAAPFTESRIKIKANTDLVKFSYKPMAMKISEASEVLDDRIDEFLGFVQSHHKLDDNAFGDPASQSTSEIVAVGRIASDTCETKLNPTSILLETSRRTGAGMRVPLNLESMPFYDFFPGMIVAVRGNNATGEYFKVSEVLDLPLLPPAASSIVDLQAFNARIVGDASPTENPCPLNILVSSGPYTSDSNLDFEPLHALVDRATATSADCLILLGPFIDVEHPLIASGNFALPSNVNIDPDTATFTDMFRALIASPLQKLTQAVPSINIVLVPSVRDAISKHVAWPQDRIPRKDLGLPKKSIIVTNPVSLTLNEIVVGISTQDILYDLRREECLGGAPPPDRLDLLARLSRHVIEQRHFFPLYPPSSRPFLSASNQATEDEPAKAMGAMLDLPYLKLGEWLTTKPDVLITPSALSPFAKIVESVLVVNPGTLSKKKGPGTFAQVYVGPLAIPDDRLDAGEFVGHELYTRTRVDVTRI